MTENFDHQITLFYGWWQMVVCLFAFLALLAIWFHLGKKQNDRGQIWLALSILCWSISGGMDVFFAYSNTDNNNMQVYLNGSRSVLSLLNSLFILLALPWFRYLPKFLSTIIQSKFWTLIVGLPFLFSLLPTLSKIIRPGQMTMISELDVYYSILTLAILGWVLWESFIKRRLSLLAYLSVACIAITFAAQIYKLTDNDINQLLFSAIFKTSLIMIFFALALSWVKDISEHIKADPDKLRLLLYSRKNAADKTQYIMNLNGFLENDKEIVLSKTHFDLLRRFAMKRKGSTDGWMEIKPKNESRAAKNYDIKDYNEIKRMLHAILDAYFGKGSWSREQHELPFKTLFIERSVERERKVRLRILPDHITLD